MKLLGAKVYFFILDIGNYYWGGVDHKLASGKGQLWKGWLGYWTGLRNLNVQNSCVQMWHFWVLFKHWFCWLLPTDLSHLFLCADGVFLNLEWRDVPRGHTQQPLSTPTSFFSSLPICVSSSLEWEWGCGLDNAELAFLESQLSHQKVPAIGPAAYSMALPLSSILTSSIFGKGPVGPFPERSRKRARPQQEPFLKRTHCSEKFELMILRQPTMLGLFVRRWEKTGTVLGNKIIVRRLGCLGILKEEPFSRHEGKIIYPITMLYQLLIPESILCCTPNEL